MEKRNLLIISNNPSRPSFRQRIEMYLDMLRRDGIEPTVAKLPAGFFARRTLFRSSKNYDGVLLHKKGLNFLDAPFLRKFSRKIIYDFDDAVMVRPSGAYSRAYARPFKSSTRMADCVIAGNTYLANSARQYNANVVILPTGLDTRKYMPCHEKPNDGKLRLVWIGSKSTLKYLEDIVPALLQISKRYNNVILRIIADRFIKETAIAVEKIPWSLDREAADLAACDIGLAPLFDTPFTRGKCGFKILQYFACGLPVIASPVGVNAELVADGENGCHAYGFDEWTQKLTHLIEHKALRIQMGQHNLVRVQQFDKDVIGHRFVDTIQKTLLNPS